MSIAGRPHNYTFASSALDGEVINFPDWARGWGLTYDVGQSGGVPPMEWFNSSYKWLNEGILYAVQHGISPWSADYDYPADAYVSHAGLTYQARAASKGITPGSNGAIWGYMIVSGLTASEVSTVTATVSGNATAGGAFNSNSSRQNSAGTSHDWTQGVFHSHAQGSPLDNRTAWVLGASTQHSGGYAVMSKVGVYRSGYSWGAAFVFQQTGENNLPMGTFSMDQDGSFNTKHVTLFKDIDGNTGSSDFSRISFRRKQPQNDKTILGAIVWDSFRDVADPSFTAAIWAEGSGSAANWGELNFGARDNGEGSLPAVTFKVTKSGTEIFGSSTVRDNLFVGGNASSNQVITYSLKSADPGAAFADMARDWDGVSTVLRWQNYGNGHTIFDASKGFHPNGKPCNKNFAGNGWDIDKGYPSLMGSNGVDTFGVRVDSALRADNLGVAKPIRSGISIETADDPRLVLARSGEGSVIQYLGSGLNWYVSTSADGVTEHIRRMTLTPDGDLTTQGNLNTFGTVYSVGRRVALEGRCTYDGAIYHVGSAMGTGAPPDGFVVTQFTSNGPNSEAAEIFIWGTFLQAMRQ